MFKITVKLFYVDHSSKSTTENESAVNGLKRLDKFEFSIFRHFPSPNSSKVVRSIKNAQI